MTAGRGVLSNSSRQVIYVMAGAAGTNGAGMTEAGMARTEVTAEVSNK